MRANDHFRMARRREGGLAGVRLRHAHRVLIYDVAPKRSAFLSYSICAVTFWVMFLMILCFSRGSCTGDHLDYGPGCSKSASIFARICASVRVCCESMGTYSLSIIERVEFRVGLATRVVRSEGLDPADDRPYRCY